MLIPRERVDGNREGFARIRGLRAFGFLRPSQEERHVVNPNKSLQANITFEG